jgi:hypothetical protein
MPFPSLTDVGECGRHARMTRESCSHVSLLLLDMFQLEQLARYQLLEQLSPLPFLYTHQQERKIQARTYWLNTFKGHQLIELQISCLSKTNMTILTELVKNNYS